MSRRSLSHITKKEHLSLDDYVQAILQNHFQDESLTVTTVDRGKNVFTEGTNFQSTMEKWTITFNRGNPESSETMVALLKIPIQTRMHKFILKMFKTYFKEVFWYMEAYPAFNAQNPIVGTMLSGECYYGFTEYNEEYRTGCCFKQGPKTQMMCLKDDNPFLLMEYLCHEGRSPDAGGQLHLLDKTMIISAEIGKAAMTTLAHFHGIWLKWLHQTPGQPKTIGGFNPDQFKKIFGTKVPMAWLKDYVLKAHTALGNHMETLGKPKDLIDAYSRYRTGPMIQFAEKTIANAAFDTSSIQTVVHGDFWLGNLLFNETETKATMIDYQGLHLAHPARDIWQFFGSCTDSSWRKEHVDIMLQTYFYTFSKYVEDSGINMGFEAFAKEIHDRWGIAMFNMVPFLPEVLNPEEWKFKKDQDAKDNFKWRDEMLATANKDSDHPTITEIKRRLVDLVEEGYQLGHIK